MRSRPRRTSRTRPACASTSRCLVTAWRVAAETAARCLIESGPSAHSRPTSASWVWSPSAAKTGAAWPSLTARVLRRDIPLDVLHLLLPALLVALQGLGAARERDAVESRFD